MKLATREWGGISVGVVALLTALGMLIFQGMQPVRAEIRGTAVGQVQFQGAGQAN